MKFIITNIKYDPKAAMRRLCDDVVKKAMHDLLVATKVMESCENEEITISTTYA